MRIADPFILELDVEAPNTRRVLERVPADRLGWKPHPRSSSVGQLALHAARLPQAFTTFVARPSLDILAANRTQAPPDSHEAILAAFDESVAAARGYLAGLDDASAQEPWRLVAGEKEIYAMPRAFALRRLLFNHWYHHRGQLTVYLRLLDVSVPVVYGQTADETPLGPRA
jgi:uncharacterized damage-inducible protein DinB